MSSADHVSYQHATSVSLFGLAIQLVLGLSFLLYGAIGDDPAALSGAFAMLLGCGVWVALGLVFNQHKQERLEALESEAYATSAAAQAAVFEGASGEELVQKSRLDWMHKWFLPIVSLALGIAYIIIGLVRFVQHQGGTTREAFTAPTDSGWAIGLSAGVGVIGFVFARYVAGMAKQPVWSMLRGGAAASVGCMVVALLVLVGHLLYSMQIATAFLRYLPIVIDWYLIILGGEIFANFLLSLYLPRKPGEYVRPAFDSRLLAFVAAPDRLAQSISEALNYQFGFDVSSTWFYRLVARSISGLVLLGALIIWGMTTVSVVGPGERGMLLRNGKLVRILESGPHIKAPWPFSTVLTFPAYSINSLGVGTPPPLPNTPILWTNEHAEGTEYLLLVQPSQRTESDSDGDDQRRDVSLLTAEIPIRYVVSDIVDYQWLAQDGPSDDPDAHRRELLTQTASRVATEVLSRYSVDQLLGEKRAEIAGVLSDEIRSAFANLGPEDPGANEPRGAGIDLLHVGLNGVHPTTEVADSFLEVLNADQQRIGMIEEAQSRSIRALSRTVGDADRALVILDEIEQYNAMKSGLSGLRQQIETMKQDDSIGQQQISELEREANATEQEVGEKQREIADMIREAGGNAGAMLVNAETQRWETHMGVRARALTTEGQSHLYDASPLVYKNERLYLALWNMLADTRVWTSAFEEPVISVEQQEQQIDVSGWEAETPSGSQ